MVDIDTVVEKARLAEQAERYEEMAEIMKEITTSLTKLGHKLSDDQRNLLSVAYKNVVGAKRSAWRVISSLKAKNAQKPDNSSAIASEYLSKIAKELEAVCNEVLVSHCLKLLMLN